MGGSYHGGGTVVGWGGYWERYYAFGKPEGLSTPTKKGSKRAARRARGKARAEAAAVDEANPRQAQTSFPKSKLSQQDVLAALGLLPLPPKLDQRGPILKMLVAEGVLLPNGRPNPHHDKVRAIEAGKGKKKK